MTGTYGGFYNEFVEYDRVLGVTVDAGMGSNISLGETTLREVRTVDETHIETVWATERLGLDDGKPTGESVLHTFPLVWEDGLWKFDAFLLIPYAG